LIYDDSIFRNREGLQVERGGETDFVGKLILARIANHYNSDISACYCAKQNILSENSQSSRTKNQRSNKVGDFFFNFFSQFYVENSRLTINQI
jgi:hypothetical protein